MDIIERTCTASSPAMCYVVLRVGVYEISAEIPPFCILYVVVCCLPIYLYVVIPPLSLKYDVTDPYSAGFTSRVQCPVEWEELFWWCCCCCYCCCSSSSSIVWWAVSVEPLFLGIFCLFGQPSFLVSMSTSLPSKLKSGWWNGMVVYIISYFYF